MYKGNIEGRSLNYWCRAKAIRITYTDCVSMGSVIHLVSFMRCIFIDGLCGSTVISPHYI
jgi:hypothetical protein